MYFTIFYKNYKIDWVLSEFDKTNISKIIRNILENTTNTTILSYGNLLCERKEDLDIIYEILMNEPKLVVKQKNMSMKIYQIYWKNL